MTKSSLPLTAKRQHIPAFINTNPALRELTISLAVLMQDEKILLQPNPVRAFEAIVGTALALACSGTDQQDFMQAVVAITQIAKDVHDKNIMPNLFIHKEGNT